jgi:hypothetical protein
MAENAGESQIKSGILALSSQSYTTLGPTVNISFS